MRKALEHYFSQEKYSTSTESELIKAQSAAYFQEFHIPKIISNNWMT